MMVTKGNVAVRSKLLKDLWQSITQTLSGDSGAV